MKTCKMCLHGFKVLSPTYEFIINYNYERINFVISRPITASLADRGYTHHTIPFFIQCLKSTPGAKLPEDLKLLLVGYMI